MDKTNVLMNLLHNKEYDTLNPQYLSNLLGKNIYIINNIYCTDDGGNTIVYTAEDLNNRDGNHESTLYLTEDKFLSIDILDVASSEIENISVKTLAGDNVRFSFTSDETYLYIKINQEEASESDDANAYSPCYVDIYIVWNHVL